MKVRVLKKCYCVDLRRDVAPGEEIECPSLPKRAIEDRLVELVIPVPIVVQELGYE